MGLIPSGSGAYSHAVMLSGKRDHALSRREILRGKSTISPLFNEGNRLKGGSVLMLFTCSRRQDDRSAGIPFGVMFTVGKKLVPKAVIRNRIKRLMREAYRLEKGVLFGLTRTGEIGDSCQLRLAILYRGRSESIPSLEEFRIEIRRMLNTMVSKMLAQPQDGRQIKHNG